MRAAPGFAGVRWDAEESVEVTTLDALIAAYGLPRFIKIDVEGFEAEVLAGLARPVPWVAFEYLPAAPEATAACIARLSALGPYEFNLVPGEARSFALETWRDAAAIAPALAEAARGGRSGDLYARLRAACLSPAPLLAAVAAVLVLHLLLALPATPGALTPTALLRLPLELPLAILLLLAVPARPTRAALTLLLIATTVLKLADLATETAFRRPFNPCSTPPSSPPPGA